MKHIGANSQYLYTVPNLSGGTVLSYNTTTKQVTHRTYAEIIGDMNLVTTNTSQNISGQKTFEKIIVSTSPDSIAGNLGTLGTNYKLALTNDGNYGTAFWVQGNGHGYIQQQRFDNNPIAYRLNLQPLGGELYYGVNEVATVNQLSNFVTLQTPQSIIATKTFTDSLVIQGNSTDNRTTKLIFKNSSDPTNTDWAISHGLYGYSNVGFSIGKWNNNVFEHGLYINELFTIFSHNHGNSSQWYEAHTWGNHALAGYATETWINTNFIPKSHPVYNVTQGQITGWESSHKVDGTTLINNGSNGRHNKTWFDYSWAGTGKLGSVLNFAGFDGYNAEMFIQYSAGNELGFRTRNGDTGVWNPVRWGWHSGNLQGYREIEIDTGLIRLKPLKVDFGAGNHSFSDPSRLIRVICSGTTGIDITELFPHQEYVIYNTGNIPTIILVGGVKKFGIETKAFRRFYVTEDLKMLVEPMEVLEVM